MQAHLVLPAFVSGIADPLFMTGFRYLIKRFIRKTVFIYVARAALVRVIGSIRGFVRSGRVADERIQIADFRSARSCHLADASASGASRRLRSIDERWPCARRGGGAALGH